MLTSISFSHTRSSYSCPRTSQHGFSFPSDFSFPLASPLLLSLYIYLINITVKFNSYSSFAVDYTTDRLVWCEIEGIRMLMEQWYRKWPSIHPSILCSAMEPYSQSNMNENGWHISWRVAVGIILYQGITDKCIMEHEIDLTILILRKGCEKFSWNCNVVHSDELEMGSMWKITRVLIWIITHNMYNWIERIPLKGSFQGCDIREDSEDWFVYDGVFADYFQVERALKVLRMK